MNQVFRGKCLRCMIVPAVHDRACGQGVTEVSFPQAAHFARRRFSVAAGGADEAVGPAPGGECRAQEASSGKPASKAARDMGRSYFQRLAITKHYTNILPTPKKLNISSNRAQRDKD